MRAGGSFNVTRDDIGASFTRVGVPATSTRGHGVAVDEDAEAKEVFDALAFIVDGLMVWGVEGCNTTCEGFLSHGGGHDRCAIGGGSPDHATILVVARFIDFGGALDGFMADIVMGTVEVKDITRDVGGDQCGAKFGCVLPDLVDIEIEVAFEDLIFYGHFLCDFVGDPFACVGDINDHGEGVLCGANEPEVRGGSLCCHGVYACGLRVKPEMGVAQRATFMDLGVHRIKGECKVSKVFKGQLSLKLNKGAWVVVHELLECVDDGGGFVKLGQSPGDVSAYKG